VAQGSDPPVSAQVILRPASGASVDPATITAATIGQIQPAAAAVDAARRAFTNLEFEVGPFVGNSFSITAPAATFEKVFGVRLQPTAGGGISVVEPAGAASLELPLHRLPADLAKDIQAVTFTPPPAFGPGAV
jgi:hypothetical protein